MVERKKRKKKKKNLFLEKESRVMTSMCWIQKYTHTTTAAKQAGTYKISRSLARSFFFIYANHIILPAFRFFKKNSYTDNICSSFFFHVFVYKKIKTETLFFLFSRVETTISLYYFYNFFLLQFNLSYFI